MESLSIFHNMFVNVPTLGVWNVETSWLHIYKEELLDPTGYSV
jgi:hypothetical protein